MMHLQVLSGLLLALAPAPQQAPVNAFEHVKYYTRDGDTQAFKKLQYSELSVDDSLDIRFDEVEFIKALTNGNESTGIDDSLVTRLKLLEPVVERFVEVNASFVGVQKVGEKFSLGLIRPTDQEFSEANQSFAEASAAADASYQEYAGWLDDNGRGSASRALKNELNVAATQKDYQGLASVIQNELKDVQALLAARQAEQPELEVQVKAWLHGRGGSARRIHVEGYDKIAAGDPMPFPRFQIGLDEQAKAEFKAAKDLGEVIKKIKSGALKEELRAARAEVKTSLETLLKKIEHDILRPKLEALRADLEAQGNQALRPLLTDIDQFLDLIEELKRTIKAFDGGEDDLLAILSVAEDLEQSITNGISTVLALVDSIGELKQELEKQVQATGLSVKQQTLDAIKTAFDELVTGSKNINSLVNTFKTVRDSLGLSRKVVAEAEEVAETPRKLMAGNSLDTSIQLMRAGEREHSDLLAIEITVTETLDSGEKRVVDTSTRRLRLRAYGVRFETRGALLFVDPRDSVSGSQDWEPVPAISYVMHFGMKDSDFWNDTLDPGLALSISLLDFSDTEDLEIGAALSVTLFKDFLWFGYGRDLQAEVDYFHVGVNPLLLGDLWNQKGISPSQP